MNPCPKPKTTRLKGKDRTELRRQCWERAMGRCEVCGQPAPLYDSDGCFSLYRCGHMSHIKSIGAGGSDTLDNTIWKCAYCHLDKEHGPQWSHQLKDWI